MIMTSKDVTGLWFDIKQPTPASADVCKEWCDDKELDDLQPMVDLFCLFLHNICVHSLYNMQKTKRYYFLNLLSWFMMLSLNNRIQYGLPPCPNFKSVMREFLRRMSSCSEEIKYLFGFHTASPLLQSTTDHPITMALHHLKHLEFFICKWIPSSTVVSIFFLGVEGIIIKKCSLCNQPGAQQQLISW